MTAGVPACACHFGSGCKCNFDGLGLPMDRVLCHLLIVANSGLF